MAGSVIGRCWYGESASVLLNGAPIAPKCSDTLWTTVDPGNMYGSAGLCYTSHTSGKDPRDARLLLVLAKTSGAINSWPVKTYKTYTWAYEDQTYTPGLDWGLSALCYSNSVTASRTFSSSSDSLNAVCLTSIYNPKNALYVNNARYTIASIDQGGYAGTSVSSSTSNLRNCAARPAALNSVDFSMGTSSSPSFTFWVERSAANGYAVQRSDYSNVDVPGSTAFSPNKPLWPLASSVSSYTSFGKFVSSADAVSPDTNVVGVSYFSSSVSSGLLYVVTTTALYGSYNPLAPYYIDRRNSTAQAAITRDLTCSATNPAASSSGNIKCFVQWHKLVYLGNGGSAYSATGNLAFPTNPAMVNGVTVNSFRGVSLSPRTCTYGYQTTQNSFRQLDNAEAVEEEEEEEEEENAAA